MIAAASTPANGRQPSSTPASSQPVAIPATSGTRLFALPDAAAARRRGPNEIEASNVLGFRGMGADLPPAVGGSNHPTRSAHSLDLPVLERAIHLATIVGFLERLSLVVELLAAGERDLDLRPWPLEIEAQRDGR